MAVFIDTSAIVAFLNPMDENHQEAADRWAELVKGEESLLATNYILVETFAVLARRLGFGAVRTFQTLVVPALEASWVDQSFHETAVAALLTAGSRDLSLADCASFELMRRQGMDAAFAFDLHFIQQGFRCIP